MVQVKCKYFETEAVHLMSLTERQADRQTDFFSHDFSWTFFIFHGEKKDSKSASIPIFGAFTEEDIDIIRQRGFNFV